MTHNYNTPSISCVVDALLCTKFRLPTRLLRIDHVCCLVFLQLQLSRRRMVSRFAGTRGSCERSRAQRTPSSSSAVEWSDVFAILKAPLISYPTWFLGQLYVPRGSTHTRTACWRNVTQQKKFGLLCVMQ